uniref:Uncharacterized protein n=1 Tax=viral metagenome TaxID=1070528 RepID=A0A6C0HZK0_9ZZZZ
MDLLQEIKDKNQKNEIISMNQLEQLETIEKTPDVVDTLSRQANILARTALTPTYSQGLKSFLGFSNEKVRRDELSDKYNRLLKLIPSGGKRKSRKHKRRKNRTLK